MSLKLHASSLLFYRIVIFVQYGSGLICFILLFNIPCIYPKKLKEDARRISLKLKVIFMEQKVCLYLYKALILFFADCTRHSLKRLPKMLVGAIFEFIKIPLSINFKCVVFIGIVDFVAKMK